VIAFHLMADQSFDQGGARVSYRTR
jgi:hypothetical protein